MPTGPSSYLSSGALARLAQVKARNEQSNYLDHIKISTNSFGYEETTKLFAMAKTIDLRMLGHLSILKPRHISGRLMAAYCKLVTAQCILDNIQTTPGGICLRDFDLQRDFQDGNENIISHTIWCQPTDHDYDCLNNIVSVYTTSRYTNNDRKVYFFYGIQNLNFNHPSYADQFIFKLNNIKMMDILQLTNRKPGENGYDFAYLQKPVLGRKNCNMTIQVHVGSDYPLIRDSRDNFKLLGIVGESVGQHIAG